MSATLFGPCDKKPRPLLTLACFSFGAAMPDRHQSSLVAQETISPAQWKALHPAGSRANRRSTA